MHRIPVWWCCLYSFLPTHPHHGYVILWNNNKFKDDLLCLLLLPVDYWIKVRCLSLIYKPTHLTTAWSSELSLPFSLDLQSQLTFHSFPNSPCPLKCPFSLRCFCCCCFGWLVICLFVCFLASSSDLSKDR